MMPCGRIRPVLKISLLRIPLEGCDHIIGMTPKGKHLLPWSSLMNGFPVLHQPIDAVSSGIQINRKRIKSQCQEWIALLQSEDIVTWLPVGKEPHKNKWMPLDKSSKCLHLKMSVASSVGWYGKRGLQSQADWGSSSHCSRNQPPTSAH